jgi:hypothetical protein
MIVAATQERHMDELPDHSLSLAPRVRRPVTEQQAFEACVARAANGSFARFLLSVREDVSIVHRGRGEVFGLVTLPLDIEVEIPVIPKESLDTVILSDYPLEVEGDVSSAVYEATSLHFGFDETVLRSTEANIPLGRIVRHLKEVSVGWAADMLEGRLSQTTSVHPHVFEGIAARVADEIRSLALVVDDKGVHVRRRTATLPRFKLSEDPVMGKNAYYGLVLTHEPDNTWYSLATFPIGDMATATSVRDFLVDRHCVAEDDDFDYRWRDAGINFDVDGKAGGEIALHEPSLERDVADQALLNAILDLRADMKKAGLLDAVDLAALGSVEYLEDPEIQMIDALAAAARNHPDKYSEFLERSAWDFAFDPLEIARARANLLKGLDIAEGLDPVPSAAPTGMKS